MKRWGLFAGLSAFFVVAWFCRPYLSAIPDVCMVKRMSGTGCPGCGLTRSVAATAHLQFQEAIQFHLFGPLVLFAALATWGLLLFGVRIRWNRRWTTYTWASINISLLVYYGVRLTLGIVP